MVLSIAPSLLLILDSVPYLAVFKGDTKALHAKDNAAGPDAGGRGARRTGIREAAGCRIEGIEADISEVDEADQGEDAR